MAVPARRGRPATRRTSAAPAPATRARKAAPAPASRRKDVTEYASKPATPYHKAFAKWIVDEVGFDPDSASSKRAAFLRGVSIATAARPSFNESEFIEEWREKTGEAKRGPKPATEKAAASSVPARRRKAAPEPEPVDEDEFDEDEEEELDDEDEFEDEDSDEEDDSDDDDFDDEDDEPEPEPAPKRRGRTAKTAPAPVARAARKATPAKSARSKPAVDDDDDFLF